MENILDFCLSWSSRNVHLSSLLLISAVFVSPDFHLSSNNIRQGTYIKYGVSVILNMKLNDIEDA